MNIGILQSAGIAGNIIDVALNHPEQQEVFTPVIYSKENGNDKNVSSDLKFGNIKAVVVAPGSATAFNFPGTMTIYLGEHQRVATVLEGDGAALSSDVLSERIRKAWHSLKRDFLCSMPRIAFVANIAAEDEEMAMSTLADLTAQGIGVFGPYAPDAYLEEQQYQHFDLTLCIDETLTQQVLNATVEQTRTKLLAGLPMVMATTDYSATFDFDSADLEEPALALRKAVYAVIDVCGCRDSYDEANQSPLPKLYHERKDDSEKVRFAIKK